MQGRGLGRAEARPGRRPQARGRDAETAQDVPRAPPATHATAVLLRNDNVVIGASGVSCCVLPVCARRAASTATASSPRVHGQCTALWRNGACSITRRFVSLSASVHERGRSRRGCRAARGVPDVASLPRRCTPRDRPGSRRLLRGVPAPGLTFVGAASARCSRAWMLSRVGRSCSAGRPCALALRAEHGCRRRSRPANWVRGTSAPASRDARRARARTKEAHAYSPASKKRCVGGHRSRDGRMISLHPPPGRGEGESVRIFRRWAV